MPEPTPLDLASMDDPAFAAWCEANDAADAEREARLTRPGALAAAAAWYAGLGAPVFPLIPRGKAPATRHGFKDATTDLQQIRDWWSANPRHNIGLPSGLWFDVIDVDTDPEGPDPGRGFVSLGICREHGILPPVLGVVHTPRGGRHLYVAPAPGAKNKAGFAPGIDYRGAFGYVAAPPSVGENGARYDWLTVPDIEAMIGGAA